jgi:glucokinase
MNRPRCAIGVDLGGTKVDIGLIEEYGKITHRIQSPTEVEAGPEGVIAQIVSGIRQLQNQSGLVPEGIGIGVAGQIESGTGNVFFSPNLKWVNVPLASSIRAQLNGIETLVTNDVRAATLGEWLYGNGKGCQDLICLYVGTGIGGGIVTGGRLITGVSNSAGELGHVPIQREGLACTCGGYGCLEAYAGGWAIARRAREAIQASPQDGEFILKLAEGNLQSVTAKIVSEAAKQEDLLAERLMNETAEALATGITGFINAFNPQKIIMGGGVIHGFLPLVDLIKERVEGRALKVACSVLTIEPACIINQGSLLGAAAQIFQSRDIKL